MFSRNLWGYDFTPGTYHYHRVNDPLGWKKPRRIFVCSMGDLFHEAVADWMLERILDRVCYDGISHLTFMLLTKRPERMAQFFEHYPCPDNVWLGVTAENQERADERIPILLQIPAAVHWVSVEPMLGPVEVAPWCYPLVGSKLPGLSGVVAGPETGPGARACRWQWIEALYEQCKAAGVPFFDKREVSPLAREYPK
jgi:protein gp37